MNITLLIIAIIPIYLIGLYIYKKDNDKESKKLLAKLFMSGIISCFLVILPTPIINLIFPSIENLNLIGLFFYVFIGIALIEELCKWIMVYKITYNHSEFNHIYDAIVYSCFVSLGFAGFENILYVAEYGLYTGLIRAISAIPGHVCNGVIMGNYLGKAKQEQIKNSNKTEKKYLILSILIPTITHGVYDYCIFTQRNSFIVFFIIFLIVLYIYSIHKVKKVSKIKNNLIEKLPNYCPHCGTKTTENFCSNCGIKLLSIK